jgi:2'-deoxynucleoside 5'-phosphate N-hydrolase
MTPKIAFVSVSFAHKHTLTDALAAISDACVASGLRANIFVNAYSFAPEQTRAMMEQTVTDIRAARVLIAEVTHKAIGVGIEVGYAAALNIPVIYVRHADAEASTTVGGIANHAVVYGNPESLRRQLSILLRDCCL